MVRAAVLYMSRVHGDWGLWKLRTNKLYIFSRVAMDEWENPVTEGNTSMLAPGLEYLLPDTAPLPAKHRKHSANTLPSVTLGKERSANCTSATASLPSTFCRAFGKEFAECHLVLGKEKSTSRRQVTVTDPLPSVFFGTRQIGQFCRVSAIMALGKDRSSGTHRQSLCRELS